ncbi:uncharacterized protein LOC133386017 [Rhineura floridana]|uniref:uncharacterized protein LOC133386017 n=1 Tax=Rhineura floridana TaxID=261503 RepID=UPI002AC859E4|nr:uncharacterized protein LOC133386017 [Rhineura floridana]
MPPRKVQQKKGVRVLKQASKRPSTQHHQPSDEEEDMGTIRALVARVDALERERLQPCDAGAGPSTASTGKKSARLVEKCTKSRILASLVSRIGVLEAAAPVQEPAVLPSPVASSVVLLASSFPMFSRPDVDGLLQGQAQSPQSSVLPGSSESSALVASPLVASPAAYAGILNLPVPVRIVLCGHSILFWVHRRASSSFSGMQLQLSASATVSWEARRGMLWDALLPLVCRTMASAAQPHILLIHLGENDLVQRPGMDLLLKVRRDLTWLRRSYPNLILVWSDMLVRRIWRGAIYTNKIDRSRKWVNRKVRDLILSLGGVCISHDRVKFYSPQLFRDDGVHLSERGCDLFLEDLRLGLRSLFSLLG